MLGYGAAARSVIKLCAAFVRDRLRVEVPPHIPKNQVELNLAKPNYRHQKKQKEQARKLRQAEKQNRRLTARTEADGTPVSEGSTVLPEGAAALPESPTSAQAET